MTAIRILPDDSAELRMIVERMDARAGSTAATVPGDGIGAAANRERILAAIFAPPLDRHPAAEEPIAADHAPHPASGILRQGHDAILADDESWWLKVYMHHERIAHPDAEEGEPSPGREGDGSSWAALAATAQALQAQIAQGATVIRTDAA